MSSYIVYYNIDGHKKTGQTCGNLMLKRLRQLEKI